MSLTIYIPLSLKSVSIYLIDLIFKNFWGINVEVFTHEKDEYIIKNIENGSTLTLPAFFISKEKDKWMEKRSPEQWGLQYVNIFEIQKFPTFFDGNTDSDVYDLNIDFLGTLFFLLNRYHELVENIPEDEHGRLIAKETFLVRNDLIHTPICDLYVNKFSNVIEEHLGFKPNIDSSYKVLPSHDVDRPFEFLYYKSKKLAKRLAGDVLIRRSVNEAIKRMNLYRKIKSGKLEEDPFNTFDWIMDNSEQCNLVSTFHFISESTNDYYDQEYEVGSSEIQNLLKKINDRGHLIALHPSYQSSEIKGQIKNEFLKLKKAVSDLNIVQEIWKSRNHFLRWNVHCLSELENAGIDIDQTLGFADQPGFRCGTCRSFKPFNFKNNSISSVHYEPLILMEVSLFDENYFGLRNDLPEAWNVVNQLKNEVKEYEGSFTLLWHNNHLTDEEMKEFYKQCIS